MVTATRDEIGDALDYEITDWRETQRDAIRNINWPNLPSEPNIFKTAAMFNFGIDATKNMFPNSIVTGIIKASSVHLYVLSQAQNAFKTEYQAAVARANTQLSNQFQTLSDSFIRQMQDICRNFKNSPQGRELTDAIYNATTGIQFIDDPQRDALLRQLIRDANLIETDPAVIRNRTNEGLTRLCVKIRDLWRASYHDAWSPDANLWYSGSTQVFLSRYGISQRWHHVRNRADQDWIIRNAWRMDVSYIENRNPFNHQRDQCYATLIGARNITQTFTGVTINPGSLSTAIRNLNRSIQGSSN